MPEDAIVDAIHKVSPQTKSICLLTGAFQAEKAKNSATKENV